MKDASGQVLLPGSRILVTGATGFIGAYTLKALLQAGYQPLGLRRKRQLPPLLEGEWADRVEWMETDVLDLDGVDQALSQVQGVIHAAALISFERRSRSLMYQTNVQGTRNLVNLSLERGIKKFIFLSSVAALPRPAGTGPVGESEPWTPFIPTSHYGFTKYQAEMEVWRAMAEGLDSLIINPSTVLGFGDWHSGSCAIFKSVYEEYPWYTQGTNGFVDVEDVASVLVRLLQTPLRGERFIVSAENRSFRDIFYAIADGFQKPRPKWRATPLLGSLAWRMESVKTALTGRPALLTRETARMAQAHTAYDGSKIRGLWPDFSFRPLEQTIRQACQAYLSGLRPRR